jgi:hypothetical protein
MHDAIAVATGDLGLLPGVAFQGRVAQLAHLNAAHQTVGVQSDILSIQTLNHVLKMSDYYLDLTCNKDNQPETQTAQCEICHSCRSINCECIRV